ncbi:septum formation inhibitor Maf [Micromonospora rosaria]|uniref:Nucleoside triphosphate pyrophosphatase n=1 Tax=Micromonospora rosaria TaxID=47874 RepID=A0A136PUE0_9ACTN|nr:nucleoside triphosphate pyrophosphatase [Micromonospora rosaria]KXK62068.1 septum formation inhibitor Maf [Micromonospora rosaria]
MTTVVLGSGSPSRLGLLRRAGLDPVVRTSGVDETPLLGETPVRLTRRLAHAKASTVAAGVADALVIGCDSVLEFEGVAYGKPHRPDVALDLWRRISGRTAVFHTGHCVVDTRTGRTVAEVCSTDVRFARVTEEDVAAYVATGEPLQMAGAFAIAGRGGWFVEHVAGHPSNLEGLSLPVLWRLLHRLDVRAVRLWR